MDIHEVITEALHGLRVEAPIGSLNGRDTRMIADVLLGEAASWNFLMGLLDHHYPESIFPTTPDNPDRDPGPRIVSLIRHLDEARGKAT